MAMAELLADYWASLLCFALFGLLHSVCAREPCKQLLIRLAGRQFVDHYWRFCYCAASYVALYQVISPLHWSLHPSNDQWLIFYPGWLWQAVIVLHLLSVCLGYVAFLQSDYLEFLGLKQVWRGLRRSLSGPALVPMKLFGTDRLEVRGIYGWVRHPMLAAGFLFLLTSGPSLNNLVFLFMYAAYMLIGGYYEERRLIRIFGAEYLDYRECVGAYFPRLPPLRPGGGG
ncbi:MAG: NnrU family protein [SAR324 cluster bacterium]|nr:NnrU family protein [SAR324 cluster bacterium]